MHLLFVLITVTEIAPLNNKYMTQNFYCEQKDGPWWFDVVEIIPFSYSTRRVSCLVIEMYA